MHSSNAIFCHFLLLIFCLRESTVQAANPLVPNNGMADPHARAFRGAVYIYATHDYSNKNTDFRMDDWWIWETTDLVHYSKVQEFQPMSWVKPAARTECWATDAAEKNNTFYWYLSIGPTEIAVVKSASPFGPWEDKLQKPLLSSKLGQELGTTIRDPGIIFDPEIGKHYIIFGTFNYFIAELGEDMMSLAEYPRKVDVIGAIGNYGPGKTDDKPFIHKRSGAFYLSWGCFYATSEGSVYGPYTFRGTVIRTSSLSKSFRQKENHYNKSEWWSNKDLTFRHGSFLSLHNQWYYFTNDITHSTDLRNKGYFRDVVAGYVHYYNNGSIAPVKIDATGVGSYDVTSGASIEVENYFSATDDIVKTEAPRASNGFVVSNISSESRLHFPNVLLRERVPLLLRLLGHHGTSDKAIPKVFVNGYQLKLNEQSQISNNILFSAPVKKIHPLGTPEMNLTLTFEGRGTISLDCMHMIFKK